MRCDYPDCSLMCDDCPAGRDLLAWLDRPEVRAADALAASAPEDGP